MTHDFWGTIASYAVAAFALLADTSNDLLAIGGAVLLVARLAIELPKAVKAIKGLIKPKE